MRPHLLLFDIDLTLIRTRIDHSGPGAMVHTLSEWTDTPPDRIRFPSFAGKTDPLIVAELFAKNGLAYVAERDYPRFMDRYLAHLEARCARGERVCLPGVQRLLRRLKSVSDRFRLGLLTGNDERGARIKLGSVGLAKFFPVGAFGSDAPLRQDLLPFALKRATRHHQTLFTPRDTIVIGDSVRDVWAAKFHNARALGVTTGFDSRDQLLAAGADGILDGFDDVPEVMATLDEIRRSESL